MQFDSYTNRLSRRFTGEVNADFMDEEGSQSLINTSRNNFIEDNEKVDAFNEWVREFIKRKLAEEVKKNLKKTGKTYPPYSRN